MKTMEQLAYYTCPSDETVRFKGKIMVPGFTSSEFWGKCSHLIAVGENKL